MELNADFLAQFNSGGNELIAKNEKLTIANRRLKDENDFLKDTITDISQLLFYTDVDDMLNFVLGTIIERFIPSITLVFVKPPRKPRVRQYFYRGAMCDECDFDEASINALLQHFEGFVYEKKKDVQGLDVEEFVIPTLEDVIQSLPENTLSKDILDLDLKYIFPLAGIGGVYGIVALSDSMFKQYTQSDFDYLHRIFSILAITLQNGLHYESSITDPKTGLFTYDYFVHRLESSINVAHRYNRISAMIMIDIDHFKWFNDSYGHLAGDKVLIELAKTLKHAVREDDCICRFGGEEFAILLSECEYNSVKAVAERIRETVEQMEVPEGDEILKVTISLGVYIISNIPNLTPTYITERADRALYHSKENGRNQATIFIPGFLDKAELSLGPHLPETQDED